MESITYSTMEHVQVPVIVLIPNSQNEKEFIEEDREAIEQKRVEKRAWPAVLACHGHGLLVVIPKIMGFGVRRVTGLEGAIPSQFLRKVFEYENL